MPLMKVFPGWWSSKHLYPLLPKWFLFVLNCLLSVLSVHCRKGSQLCCFCEFLERAHVRDEPPGKEGKVLTTACKHWANTLTHQKWANTCKPPAGSGPWTVLNTTCPVLGPQGELCCAQDPFPAPGNTPRHSWFYPAVMFFLFLKASCSVTDNCSTLDLPKRGIFNSLLLNLITAGQKASCKLYWIFPKKLFPQC